MGDTDAQPSENTNTSEENNTCDEAKPSIDVLKEVKPSRNIAIHESVESNNAADSSMVNVDTSGSASEVETAKTPETTSTENVEEKETKIEEEKEHPIKAKSSRNKSDIFSLNETKNMSSTIFSVGGIPSKTIRKTGSASSNQTVTSTDTALTEASTASFKQSQLRNPLTGMGVSSNDEFKNKPSRRKDGNPVLGVGYKDDDEVFNPQHTQRIPPGGYSKGLW